MLELSQYMHIRNHVSTKNQDNYKDSLKKSMELVAQQERSIFVGYGLYPNGGSGTFKDISPDKFIEYPVAESLMLSSAIGLSIAGYLPLVFIERFDFIMNGMDALVNHLDKIKKISCNSYKPGVIIRAMVGSTTKLPLSGPTHIQDFSSSLELMLENTSVVTLKGDKNVISAYKQAISDAATGRSSIIVEYKDLY